MPSEAQRLHPFAVVSGTLRIARQLILPAILGGASAGSGGGSVLAWILVIMTVPSVIGAVARWSLFRYRLADDELIIDSGVLSRRRRVIPLSRIQNIDLEQSALERLFSVAELRMETASGGKETEASLSVLSLTRAQELQAELMRRRAAAISPTASSPVAAASELRPDGAIEEPALPPTGPAPAPVLELSTTDLMIAGATSNEAGLIAAGLATLIQVADDVGGLERVAGGLETVFERGAALGVAGAAMAVAALVVVFVVVGWVLSVVVTAVRFHGFTLTLDGDDLRREYGLFSRHRSTVPLERVQAVRIEETLLRRPLGLVALKIETAGSAAGQGSNESGGAEAFVPIARRRDVGRLISAVFPDARMDGVSFQPVHPLARRRALARASSPIIMAAAGLGLLLDPGWLWLLAALPLAWLWARAYYRSLAWARAPGYALARGGVMTRLTWLIPEHKIQTLHLGETPFQRRLNLASLFVDTAAGGRVARVHDLDRETADGLLEALAVDAEAARRWVLNSSRAG